MLNELHSGNFIDKVQRRIQTASVFNDCLVAIGNVVYKVLRKRGNTLPPVGYATSKTLDFNPIQTAETSLQVNHLC